MKTSIFSQTLLAVTVVAAGFNARAEDRFSVQKWTQELASSLKSKSANSTAKLLDFEAIDKKISNSCDDCDNKALMKKARDLYAAGKYEEARATYNQVSKKSGYWLQAVEEKAWTYFRQNQFDDALAQTKTLLSIQFADYVNSEAYFLQTLSQLKVCDYKDLFKTNTLFKEKQKARLVEIQSLSDTGTNEAFKNVIVDANSFPMRLSDVGANANHLPQLFFRDRELQKQLLRYKLSDKALGVLSAGGKGAEFVASLEKTRAQAAAGLKNRMKALAQQETNDNFKIVQKINLVEVEAIQRLHVDVDMDKSLMKKDEFKKTTADQLVFVDDGRPWIDELDKYEVRTKACPQNIRRKM